MSGDDTACTISLEEWTKLMNSARVRERDLNELVMNYLVSEGYRDAAEAFAEESGAPGTFVQNLKIQKFVSGWKQMAGERERARRD